MIAYDRALARVLIEMITAPMPQLRAILGAGGQIAPGAAIRCGAVARPYDQPDQNTDGSVTRRRQDF